MLYAHTRIYSSILLSLSYIYIYIYIYIYNPLYNSHVSMICSSLKIYTYMVKKDILYIESEWIILLRKYTWINFILRHQGWLNLYILFALSLSLCGIYPFFLHKRMNKLYDAQVQKVKNNYFFYIIKYIFIFLKYS